jgi:hypothetical protein
VQGRADRALGPHREVEGEVVGGGEELARVAAFEAERLLEAVGG